MPGTGRPPEDHPLSERYPWAAPVGGRGDAGARRALTATAPAPGAVCAASPPPWAPLTGPGPGTLAAPLQRAAPRSAAPVRPVGSSQSRDQAPIHCIAAGPGAQGSGEGQRPLGDRSGLGAAEEFRSMARGGWRAARPRPARCLTRPSRAASCGQRDAARLRGQAEAGLASRPLQAGENPAEPHLGKRGAGRGRPAPLLPWALRRGLHGVRSRGQSGAARPRWSQRILGEGRAPECEKLHIAAQAPALASRLLQGHRWMRSGAGPRLVATL